MKHCLLIICAVGGLLTLAPGQAKAHDYAYPGWVEYHRPHWNYWAWRRHERREHWRREHWARERYWHRWHD
ncbi:MAG TPA: hypothetical protein VFO40_13740 [Chthoniobacterales bacterium]|nr:hypothetical protein [Chthoniobacterales bacterium]